jgi:hypothetical protein
MSKSPIEMIAAERQRQMTAEGWTPEHDDTHVAGEMAQAAACYAFPTPRPVFIKTAWPWDREFWKPGDLTVWPAKDPHASVEGRMKDLTRAGALIVAEMERLQRLVSGEAPHAK